MEDKRKIIIIAAAVIVLIIALAAAYTIGYRHGYSQGKSEALVLHEVKEVKLPAEIKTETVTEVKYVEKATDSETGLPEKTDLEANVGKQELTVKVNGREQVIHKANTEKYVLDKSKIILDQQSKASLEIKVPVVDNTRKWSAGIGYGNHGLAGKVDFPIKRPVGGWVYGDKSTVAAGIQVNF